MAVTKEDVAADASCASLSSGRSELVGLALWLIAQRSKVRKFADDFGHFVEFVSLTMYTTSFCPLWLHLSMCKHVHVQWWDVNQYRAGCWKQL